MTQKQLEKELKEAREEIKRLTDELKCARCTKGQTCPVPYVGPYVEPYPPVQPYRPWWGITPPPWDWAYGSVQMATEMHADATKYTFTINPNELS